MCRRGLVWRLPPSREPQSRRGRDENFSSSGTCKRGRTPETSVQSLTENQKDGPEIMNHFTLYCEVIESSRIQIK